MNQTYYCLPRTDLGKQRKAEETLFIDIFHLPTLMHNLFINFQYLCYITILDMFRAVTCPSSGGQIVLSQHLVSSLSVQNSTVYRMRADCSAVCSHPVYCTVLYRE